MISGESTNHFNELLLNDKSVFSSRKNKHKIEYPDILPGIKPTLHEEGSPDAVPPEIGRKVGKSLIIRPNPIIYQKIKILIFPQVREKQKNLLVIEAKVTIFRNLNKELSSFFAMQDNRCMWKNNFHRKIKICT